MHPGFDRLTRARAREREKRAAELETLLATSHLALLRAQIQPHFLFNTLHAVSARWCALTPEPPRT